MFSGVFQQFAAKLARQQDGANFSLEGDLGPTPLGGLHGDIPHLGHPDTGSADGLHQQGQPLLPTRSCRGQQPLVLLAGQFTACVAEQAALDFQKFCPALVPAQKMKQSVKCSQHRINGHRGVVFREQVIPPFGNQFPGNWSAVQPAGKGPDIPEILFNGAGAPLLPPQMCRI